MSQCRKPARAGRFIAVEGVDGVGKSAAVGLVGKIAPRICVFKSPPDRMAGARGFFDNGAAPEARFLFYLSCTAELSGDIRRALLEGDACCDRHLLSTIAYHNVMCGRQDLEAYASMAKGLGIELPFLNIILFANRDVRSERLRRRADQGEALSGTDSDLDLTEAVQREYVRLVGEGAFRAKMMDTSRISQMEVAQMIVRAFDMPGWW